jgi:hypothetical protein
MRVGKMCTFRFQGRFCGLIHLFFLAFTSLILAPSPSLAQDRGFALYPEHLPQPSSDPSPSTMTTKIALPETRGLIPALNSDALGKCTLRLSHTPLLYQTLQMGLECNPVSESTQLLRAWVLPEMSYRSKGRPVLRPGALLGIGHSFYLTQTGSTHHWVYGQVSYKWVPLESRSNSKVQGNLWNNPGNLQRFGDVFESTWGFGVGGESGVWKALFWQSEAWGYQIRYSETLPSSFRSFGGLSQTRSTSFKYGEINGRMTFRKTQLGLGGGYGVFSFDGVRVLFPFPTAYFAYLF